MARLTDGEGGPVKGGVRSRRSWRSRRGADRHSDVRNWSDRVRRRSGSSAAWAPACSRQ
jgi:hypothetical protein